MKNKRKFRILVVVLVLISILAGDFNIKTAFADTSCSMTDGVITISITSKAATTDIRYRTIGFTLTSKYQSATTSAKGITGPDAPIGPGAELYLSDGMKKDLGTVNGLTTTVFTFTETQVKNALKNVLDLNNISTDTKIYFNAIFQTYEIINDKEIILNSKITTWKDIVTDQDWGSISGFIDYFNIAVTFKPGPQPNSLYYDLEGTENYQRELSTLDIGKEVNWSGYVTNPATVNGKVCNLTGFYVKNKLSGAVTEERHVGDVVNGSSGPFTLTAAFIVNSASATVQYGGMDVHMIYEVDSTQIPYTNSLYYVYDGTAKRVCDLTSLTAGKNLTWSTAANLHTPDSVFGSGKTYNLQGYYIEAKDKTSKLQGTTSLYKNTDGATDSQIIGGKAIVVKGGLNVYIVYSSTSDITPTPPPTVTPVPTIPPLDIPDGGSEIMPVSAPEATGIIKADIRDSERFVVEQGIPTTESLYTQATTIQYLIGYNFEKEVVVKEYTVTASKTYTLTWKNAKDPTMTVMDTVTLTRPVTIKRACAYWIINSLDYYIIDNATIYNAALPGGRSTMYPDSNYYSPPALCTSSTKDQTYHMIEPVQQNGTVVLDPETIVSQNDSKPVVSTDSFQYEADKKVGEIKVRNDYVSFNGSVIMNNNIYTKETPALSNLSILTPTKAKTGINVLYKPNQIIEQTLANNTYYSSGTITYKQHLKAVNSTPLYSGPIININQVKVHTPIICDPSITANNKKWVQLISPDDDCVPLVLDPDSALSDFSVSISNTGKHSDRVGYYTRNMAWSLRKPNEVSYLAEKNDFYRNEVKFPFDVYLKKTSGEDEYIPKETWIRIAFNSPTFYLPMWVEEGKYTVQFRSIAVNADTNEKILMTEKYANTDPNNYVATNSIKVQVSGRIYGLTITDVSDDRDWNEVFHYKGMSDLKIDGNYKSGVDKTKYSSLYSYDYVVGNCDQYGNVTSRLSKFILPLVNGSHPRWANVGILKKGYSVNFKLTTIGSLYGSGDSILIRPKFYYVDAQGKNRQEVDIYYSQYFNGKSNDLVKVGGALDKTNINTFRIDDLLPKNVWQTMADIFNIKYPTYQSKKLQLFTYSKMQIYSPMMAYSNNDYLTNVKSSGQYSKIKDAGIKPVDIMKHMQTWYGEYWLPADIHAVAKGYDILGYVKNKGINYHESFWKTGGYIIVNFEIVTVNSKGNEQLSYTNINNALNGYCSMWNMEGAAAHKTSYNGKAKKSVEFNFEPGDFLIYYTDISLRDDYTTYIIN